MKLRDHLDSGGFSIEMEMVSKLVKLDYSIYSVPITYRARAGDTKLESIKDGLKIFLIFFRNLSWSPPRELVCKQTVDLLEEVVEGETADLLS